MTTQQAEPDRGIEQEAVARGDWHAALAELDRLATLHPGHAGIHSARGDAELQCRLREADAAQGDPPQPARRHFNIPTGATAPDEADRALMLRFESLGLDCEFGLVQRHYGAEPLGLFRWNGVMPEALCDGLEHDFAGIGDPATTTLHFSEGRQEYLLKETRYGMGMHTFIYGRDPDVPKQRLHAQLCRRAGFLRGKLLSDLADAEKILLYQFPTRLHATLRARLRAAVLRHNPDNILLLVREQRDGETAGAVTRGADGVLDGVIDHLCGRRGGWDTLSTGLWRTICRNAVMAR
jgi:hypothetical protein